MTIPGVLIRYFITYVVLVLIVSRILAFADVGANAIMFLGVIVGSAYWPVLMYGRKNRRYFSSADKIHVIGGMTLIDMVFQALFGNLVLPGSAPPLYSFYSFLIIAWLHGALILLIVQLTGRMLRREGILPRDQSAS